MATAEGWYKDPSDPALARWWTGAGWGDATKPISEAVSPPSPPGPVVAPVTGSIPVQAAQVHVSRRLRPWRLPCGHCSAKLPRFMALAPAVVTCPRCARHTQVMEGALFRRGYAVS